MGLSQCDCPPLPVVADQEVRVTTVAELSNALDLANSNGGNMTIVLASGEYNLTSNLRFIGANMSNLAIIGETDSAADVVIRGLGWNNNEVTHIFNVAADNFTLANMTIGEVFYHPVQVHSNPNDADNFHMQNVHIVDAKEQLLKVSAGGTLFADNGKVICCEFEFTAGIAYQYYTGGIDAHRAKNWSVINNTFKHIRSPESDLAEHAIHFWRDSQGTLVEGNVIINCDRGIGFGLGNEIASGHTGGLIRNNFVHTSRDVGIGLESSTDTKIYNNTVITENYPRSIEYRFPTTTNAHIVNNITNGSISDRSSGSTGSLATNYVVTDLSIFEDASQNNYHLSGYLAGVTDSGTSLVEVTNDIDCDVRHDGLMDIGADEMSIPTCLPGQSCEVIAGNIRVDATFENIGVTYNISGDDDLDSEFQLKYRVQGSSNWKNAAMSVRAHPGLIIDGSTTSRNYHAASAMHLQVNTTYELQLILIDPDGGSQTSTLIATTKAIPQPSMLSVKYVSPGNGGGSGTESDPYLGLQTAADVAVAGDHFIVSPGEYDPFVIIDNGIETAPISFISEIEHCAIIDGNNTDRHIIQIGDFSEITSHIIVDGFTIQNGNWGIDAQNTQFVTVRNNIFQDVEYGYYNRREFVNERDQYITNNVFIGRTAWPGTGIPKERAIDIRGDNNVVSYNTIRNFGDGIATDGPGQAFYSLDVHNNDIKNIVDDLIEVDWAVSNTRVYANRLYNGRAGVSLAPVLGGPVYVFRNEIFNLENSGLKMNRGPSGLVIVNNTIVSSGTALSSTPGWQNTFFRNNVVFAERYCFEEYDIVAGSKDDWDYDAFYSARSATSGNEWFKYDDLRYPNITELKTGTQQESDAIVASPSDFNNIGLPITWNIEYDPSQRDLMPRSGTNIINSGFALDNINDPFNAGSQTDRGALEFGMQVPQYGAVFEAVDCALTVLPLELISFVVANEERDVSIKWETINEENLEYFIVERRHESEKEFQSIVKLKANNLTLNSQEYRSVDKIIGLTGQYFYRLKSVDSDNSYTYSDVRSILVNDIREGKIIVYPNPTNDELNIIGLDGDTSDLRIRVFSRIGQEQSVNYTFDDESTKINLQGLFPGIYFVEVSMGANTSYYKVAKE